MARINLLPWRENLRQQRQRNFMIALVATAAVAVLLVFLGSHLVERQIDAQEARNQYLEGEIRKLDREIASIEELEAKRDNLLARKNVIERLQENRSMMVHLFNALALTIPEGVRLNSVQQSEEQLTLQGTTQSETRVSDYMRNIEQAEWLHDPVLSIIEAIEGEEGGGAEPFRFELRARMASPNAVEAEAQDEEA
ncbi:MULTISPECIES: PilN domain-containing protein [unclassified Wenzhouxiangella]|uniref:PilN domain-containing protein n=1 Tax=unclassified Wenzhouxiangella TaxID=2613841 RepID=UPI000E3278C5|nr:MULTISPECIES: PilN domain-containing protein [unclassified Wenzhouxiangella]RFF28525.1 pilus assembly protein PilN [Wenzhouxiangella sp. 15181]RFP70043.1 pilus assembly protein PilN [Wenzhouxiangella sp. 15190]